MVWHVHLHALPADLQSLRLSLLESVHGHEGLLCSAHLLSGPEQQRLQRRWRWILLSHHGSELGGLLRRHVLGRLVRRRSVQRRRSKRGWWRRRLVRRRSRRRGPRRIVRWRRRWRRSPLSSEIKRAGQDNLTGLFCFISVNLCPS